MAIDPVGKRIYWELPGSIPTLFKSVVSSKLDGTDMTPLLADLTALGPNEIAVDTVNGFLFVTGTAVLSPFGLTRTALDGSAPTTLFTGVPVGDMAPHGPSNTLYVITGTGLVRSDLAGQGPVPLAPGTLSGIDVPVAVPAGCVADSDCDDTDPCTDDVCDGANGCLNTPTDCDDDSACTTDSCDSGTGCVYVPSAVGTACDDGLFCTENDKCQTGAECLGTAVDCDDGEPCTKDGCDALDGLCVHAPQSGPCDDGDSCTENDDCGTGTCTGSDIDCSDGNACTDDSCGAGGCTSSNNSAGCDDDNECTTADTCNAGSCVGGAAPDCDDGNSCTDDSCQKGVGCVSTPNSAACDDGLNCTINDTCTTGDCIGAPQECDDNEPCTKDGCDSSDGLCVHAPIKGPCNDDNACTENTTCATGQCEGDVVDCNDSDPCTADSCNPSSGCVNAQAATGADCDDGDACTEDDVCTTGGACEGDAVDCDDNNPCSADSCDSATGCVSVNVASGTSCSDGDVCDGAETCLDGVCTAGTPLDCNDLNPCTNDSCHPTDGCASVNNTLPCTDGDVCNGDEECADGVCEDGTPLDCDDGNQCTADTCDAIDGCANANLTNGDACDDGNACTDADTCVDGGCTAGDDVNCNDKDACTNDACDPASGCTYEFNTNPCNDFDECNGAEQCDGAGNCAAGTPIDCDDGNPCTDDSCDPSAGCQYADTAAGTSCADGDACNGDELCAEGACAPGTAPDCDDGNTCTDDSCDSSSGCVTANVASGTDCGDGDTCNGDETCLDGVCTGGTALDCDDDDVCTADTCDAAAGCQNDAIEDCCAEDADCPERGACVEIFCDLDANECASSPIADCCTEDSECDDGSDGTDDACDLTTNTCTNTPKGCLADAALCDDSDACTDDICGSDGTCSNEAIEGCCALDEDCGDAELCDENKQCVPDGSTPPETDTGGGEDPPELDWGPDCAAGGSSGGSQLPVLLLLFAPLVILRLRRRSVAVIAPFLAVMLLAPQPAAADWPDKSIYLDIYGGGNLVVDKWDLHKVGNAGIDIDHGLVFGAKLGGYPLWWLGLEGGLGVLPLSTDGAGDNTALDMHVGALFHLMKTSWSPYLTAGGGFYRNVSGDLGKDVDYNAFYGVGVVGRLNSWLGLRLQARHVLTDGYEGEPGLGGNVEIIAALRFNLWQTEADRDKDGIMDMDDDCPDTPGHKTARGCPDRDGDGIRDKDDKCPDTPGPAKHDGCPDRDGDGIIDKNDKCPDNAGVPELQGCKDTDKDGLMDHVDKCPLKPEDKDGFEDADGCPDPDNDKDGILDVDDKCPLKPETKNGYKDADGCPDTVPTVIKEKEIVILEKVYFDFNKATIKPESHDLLGAVAKALKEHPEILKIEVGGHTDDVGTTPKNQRLSERRAKAVVAYLVGKGVAKSRLKFRGYGEAKPLVRSKTDEARAKNRRVEFKITKRAPKK